MKTPRLNRRLALETRQQVADGSGGFQVTWQTLGLHWAEVTARTGRAGSLAGAPVSEVAFRIVVRAAPVGDTARPQPEQRFRDGDRCFSIKAVAEDDADARFLTCFAIEEVAA